MLQRLSVRRWLGLIVLGTIVGRVAFILLFGHTLSLQTSGYDAYAVHVMDGQGYTRFDDRSGDSDLPPLYPFFLVAVYTVFGRDPIPVALVQIGFDVIVVLLLYQIGWRMASEAVGLLAAAFYGFYPYLLYQNLTLNDTGLFILLLVAGIWAAYRTHDTQDWRWAAVLGLCFGLGALTKTLIVLVLPLLALWWWREISFRPALRLSLISGALMVVVIFPWAMRNTRLHGELVLISTNAGSNLHQGNNACVDNYLAQGWDAQWVNCIQVVPPELDEPAAERWHREQAINYLRDHPEEWHSLFWTKFWVLWSPVIMPYDLPPDPYLVDDAVLQFNSRTFQFARVIHMLYFAPLLGLSLFGLVVGWRDRRPIEPLAAVMVAVTITYLIFHPSTRYRSPADPFVFVLSAYAVTWLWAHYSRKTHSATVSTSTQT
ncbi:MAG: glycosyltransferase family 39 protein [Chloroflexi bacterium]|nr:glycosyltransferase family 39 protein [Chloroflexota bacterium]